MDQDVQSALAEQNEKIEALSALIENLSGLVETSNKKAEEALAEKTRSEEIAALCQQAGVSNAAEYIADASLSVDDVKGKLFSAMCEKVAKLGEEEGDVAPSEYDKLNAEWHKNEAILSKAGWKMEEWKKATASERGIQIPASDS